MRVRTALGSPGPVARCARRAHTPARSNFASFVRQLNNYGFRKCHTDRYEFGVAGFQRGSPELLKSYPVTVGDGDRYEFEHGNRSIARHANSLGLGCYMVTWGGVFPPEEWHHVTNDQSLILDQHTDSMGYT